MVMADLSGTPRSDNELQEAINAIQKVMVRDALTLPPLLVVHCGIIIDCLKELQQRRFNERR